MNRIFNALLLIGLSGTTFAQQMNISGDTTKPEATKVIPPKNLITITVGGTFASNFITRDIIFKNYWSSDIIDKQVDKLSNLNRGGIEAKSDVYLYLNKHNLKRLSNSTLWFGAHNLLIGGVSSNQDFLKLVLKGNKENRNVSFDQNGFATQFIGFSQMNIGLRKSVGKGDLKFGIGLLVGHNLTTGNIYQGTLNTSEQGDLISAQDIDFRFLQANGGSNKGLGSAIQFEYTKYLNAKNKLTLGISDLGFIRWNDVTSYDTRNQSFNYEGFDVTGFWNKDYAFDLNDSLEAKYIEKHAGPQTMITPFLAEVNYRRSLSATTYFVGSAKYRYMPGYLPLVTASYGKYLMKSVVNWVEVGLDAGGFGMAAVHIGSGIKISSKVNFKLELTGIESAAVKGLTPFWMARAGLGFSF